jgi:hypothetical protein
MAIIPQPQLFSWQQVETASDMDRLRLALKAMPDEPLMQALEEARMGRRDDYPIRALWNRVIAGIVFEHISVEQLRRELSRNAELRQRCGFDVFLGDAAVPPSWVYSRSLKKLFKHPPILFLCAPCLRVNDKLFFYTKSPGSNAPKFSSPQGGSFPPSDCAHKRYKMFHFP